MILIMLKFQFWETSEDFDGYEFNIILDCDGQEINVATLLMLKLDELRQQNYNH